MNYFQDQINALGQQLTQMEAIANALPAESAERRQILDIVNQTKTAMMGMNAANKQSFSGFERIIGYMKTMLVYRGLRKMWSEAKEYATGYADSLKEIQVVTQMSDDQVESMSEHFKTMSKDLGVSMTEIANAATIFYRQGLGDEQVAERLTWATKYSKIAKITIEDAAQSLTATMNSISDLNNDAQRVVDVFTYMGDHAATSGAEISTAMQKAAATADNAGMEFEFLAASIASVSATTRQNAESIGTAFNTMMARLHSIKQRGFNEEDETKINDVAKALASAGIKLMDADGEWRRFDAILTELSGKWVNLTDKQQSYIATTMAGVRAQNYFIALMKDMSKGIEGGSKMWELYNGAMNSAGIVNDKYATWLTSTEAAQQRLTAAVEQFFTVLNTDDALRGFYNNIAGFVEVFTKGTEAMNGMNLVIPLIIGGIIALGIAIKSIIASGGLVGVFTSHPYATIAAAVISVVVAVTTLVGAMSEADKGIDHFGTSATSVAKKLSELENNMTQVASKQKEWTDKAEKLTALRDKYTELTTQTKLTADQQAELKKVLGEIQSASPTAGAAIDGITNHFEYQRNVVQALNNDIAQYTENARKILKSEAEQTGFKDLSDQISETLEQQASAEGSWAEMHASYQEYKKRHIAEYNNDLDKLARDWFFGTETQEGKYTPGYADVLWQNAFGDNDTPYGPLA